jgi:hypothetical protein
MEEDAVAKELLPDALWARIAPLLPPKPKGGRSRVSVVQLQKANNDKNILTNDKS